MNCPKCNSINIVKVGFSKLGEQAYRCKDCNRSFIPGTKLGRPPSGKPKPEKTHKSIRVSIGTYEKLFQLSQELNISIPEVIEKLIAKS